MTDEQNRILIETEQRSKSNTHRISELAEEMKEVREKHEALYEMAASIKLIAQRMDSIETKVDDTNRKVDTWSTKVIEMENKPAVSLLKNADSIKIAVITAICVLLATGIVNQIIELMK